VLGYAWDTSALALEEIDGVSGAARVNTTANTGPGYAMGMAAGSQDYALLLDSKGALYVAMLPGGTPQKLSAGPWSGVAISASGVFAVAYAASGAAPQLISGLPGVPVLHAIDAQGVGVSGAAVSDNGTALLAGNTGDGMTVLAVASGGTASRALTVGGLGGMAFVPGSDRALVADAVSGNVTQLTSVSTVPAPSVVSGAKISAPVGLDVSADGRWAVVANAAGMAIRLDLSGQSLPVAVKCGCSPNTVRSLSGSAFRLTDVGSSTGWMVDAGGASPRMLFIPALPVQKASGGGL
jgi:hypothetical protein